MKLLCETIRTGQLRDSIHPDRPHKCGALSSPTGAAGTTQMGALFSSTEAGSSGRGSVVSIHKEHSLFRWHCPVQMSKYVSSRLSTAIWQLIFAVHTDALRTEFQGIRNCLCCIDQSCQQLSHACHIFHSDHATEDIIALVPGAHAGVQLHQSVAAFAETNRRACRSAS